MQISPKFRPAGRKKLRISENSPLGWLHEIVIPNTYLNNTYGPYYRTASYEFTFYSPGMSRLFAKATCYTEA